MLILRTCESVNYDKKDFADAIKFRILRQGNCPGGPHVITDVFVNEGGGKRVRIREGDGAAEAEVCVKGP